MSFQEISPSVDARLNSYIGSCQEDVGGTIVIDADVENFVVFAGMSFDVFWRTLKGYPFGIGWLKAWNVVTLEARYLAYIKPVVDLLDRKSTFGPVLVRAFDNRKDFEIPVICKSVEISRNKGARYLLPLDYQRHWGEVWRVDEFDRPFRKKKSQIVWRGVTTGSFREADVTRSRHRLCLARMYERLAMHNIGFSGLVQVSEGNSDIPIDRLQNMIKNRLSLSEQLDYKYLLSLEGNDVASGLKWMLYSNSVVLMPKPTCQTWACEHLLAPYVHYVPLKDDLSDLMEQYEWCESEPARCEEIAGNGREFVSSFLDEERENVLEEAVFERYESVVRYDLSDRFRSSIARYIGKF